MLSITETTREEVEKIIRGLGWVSTFWSEKMRAIAIEGKMTPKEFNELKDTGLKFLETFVLPIDSAYKYKLGEFKVDKGDKVITPVEATGEPEQPRGSLPGTGASAGKGSGDPVGESVGKVTAKSGRGSTVRGVKDPDNITLTPAKPKVPDSLKPAGTFSPAPAHASGSRGFHRKNRKSFKKSNLTMEQRDQITNRWIENDGKMNELKCSELAKEMGFGGPNQVQGWVSYLVKICNNNDT